jgi:putative transposase
MWTDTTRGQYARAELALPSDLTDAKWALLEAFFPAPCRVGRARTWPLRRIVEAILYLLRGGLPWRMLPLCFPPGLDGAALVRPVARQWSVALA